MKPQTISPIISIKEACQQLSICRETLNEIINDQQISSFIDNHGHIKRKRWVLADSCINYLLALGKDVDIEVATLPAIMSVIDVHKWFNIGKTKTYSLIADGHFASASIGGDEKKSDKRIIYTESILNYLLEDWGQLNIHVYDAPDTLSMTELINNFPISRTKSVELIGINVFKRIKKKMRNRVKTPIVIETASVLAYFLYSSPLSGS
jgi:hypothetical protein